MKLLFALLFLVGITLTSKTSFAQNLMNLDSWTIGQGSTGMFTQNGQNSENNREWGEGPDRRRAILWKASPAGNGDADGGWNSIINVDPSKMYRLTIWLKKTNSNSGQSYFGCENINDLQGAPAPNPYFWYGQLPELNKWYLLVGYIHGSDDPSVTHFGGIYDAQTGLKLVSTTDYKFSPQSTYTYHRTYLYYDPNTSDRQYFYAPRMEVINGNEPSIESLLAPSISQTGNTLIAGKVGIQTNDPGNYELAVNGEIRAKEVRVETGWSDFVFEKDYVLRSLKEVETFISDKKHLPEIPSSQEVALNGINVGSINSKLLQKIEELTLYIIQMNKEIEKLKVKK